jgi:hypothetical protein
MYSNVNQFIMGYHAHAPAVHKNYLLSHEDIQAITPRDIIFHWKKVSGTSIVTIKNSDAYILFCFVFWIW